MQNMLMRSWAVALVLSLCSAIGTAHAADNLAPGFSTRATNSKLLLVPVDMELFSISGGGVQEPRADWTEAAGKHFNAALDARKPLLGTNLVTITEQDVDAEALGDINALHGAVAGAVFLHHRMGALKLPTKNGQLDWSMGEAVQALRAKTGADYALFTWIRDSYASAERKAAMVVMAILGVGLPGGAQIGYASLVDLNTGRVVWFNDLRRASGDLREEKAAAETLETLLQGFPALQ